jgi:superfamily II DNA or RNA helicase
LQAVSELRQAGKECPDGGCRGERHDLEFRQPRRNSIGLVYMEQEQTAPKFGKGEKVQLISDASRVGIIEDFGPVYAGVQWYRAFWGAVGTTNAPEYDLRTFRSGGTAKDDLVNGNLGGYQEFQRLITYQKLVRDKPLRNNIYAFNASRTRFLPYQFKPLMKFLDSPRHRLLIADEVGLGKTIEAGLILRELRARETVRHVLVVCPANLTVKWQMELRRRFDEDFRILSTRDFLQFIEDYTDAPDRSALNGIVSLEGLRQQKPMEQLEAVMPQFDVVIVDEAHHMRNFGTRQRHVGELLSQMAGTMLMLTATPVHLGSENLFSLLNVLDEEDFPDKATAEVRFRDNEPVVRTQVCLSRIPPLVAEAKQFIEQAGQSRWVQDHPLYPAVKDVLEHLSEVRDSETDARRLVIQLQRFLAELNLLSHILTRSRKREVQPDMAPRRAFSEYIEMSPPEQEFYEAVTDFVRAEARAKTDIQQVHVWLLITPQRRVASSIPAMVEFYRKHLGLDSEDRSEDEDVEELDAEVEEDVTLREARERLKRIIANWRPDTPDSKYKALVEIFAGLRAEGDCKVMLFAFFKDTLKYLSGRLAQAGFANLLITGDVPASKRSDIIERFRTDSRIKVLLSSRVGSEGLDFQFCNTLINYDLPWNPMEVEQRIGRLDRIGQESPVIRIFNLWTKGTIEERILKRLYERIKVFERSIGELEMILGEVIGKLEREIFSGGLSPEEQERGVEQALRAIEQYALEIKRVENESVRFIGTDEYFNEEVVLIRSRRRYVTGEQLRRFLEDFIRVCCPRTRLEYDSWRNLGRIYPDTQLSSLIGTHGMAAELSLFLGSIDRGMDITFDSQTAFANPRVEFINVLHPVVRMIADHYAKGQERLTRAHHVVLGTSNLPPGYYFFFVFLLHIHGARSSSSLEMVVLNEDLTVACDPEKSEEILGETVERGENPSGFTLEIDRAKAEEANERAEAEFLSRVGRILEEVKRTNDAFVERRTQSLRSYYEKNIGRQNNLYERATAEGRQERYLRMLRGTMARLRTDFETKERELEGQRRIGSDWESVTAGVLEVR